MLFHTYTFLLFMLAVLLGHRLLPWRAARWFLLVASYFFYASSTWYYIFLLGFCTLATYTAARLMLRTATLAGRRIWLLAGIVSPLAVLAVYKYSNFALSQVHGLLGLDLSSFIDPQAMRFLLPVGISFYTFQSVAYVVDVYRGGLPAVRNFGTYALYISFFPQLVAGPIERGHNILPQLKRKHVPDAAETTEAVYLFLRGLVKKVVFADRLGIFVDHIYSLPASSLDGSLWWLATLCFSFQIYLDFSAYTDMALACGRLIGVRLSENFRYPYCASNPRDFWRRWHMTLSSWLRDYLYIPLGGNAKGKLRQYLNIMLVMFIAGLWHGAAWHFVAWGVFMGLLIVGYDLLRVISRTHPEGPLVAGPVAGALGMALTFALVTLGWVFFRAPSIDSALSIIGRMLAHPGDWLAPLQDNYRFFVMLCFLLYATHLFGSSQRLQRLKQPATYWGGGLGYGLRWGAILLLLYFGAVERTSQFIYFEF